MNSTDPKTIELTDFFTCEAALREPDLKQSLYDEGALLMDRVLVTLHGEAHRTRRLSEMRVFRRDFFKRFEAQVIPQIFTDVMATRDVTTSLDLVDLNYRFMVYLALAFAGVDQQNKTVAELDQLIYLLRMFGVAATLGQAKEGRDKEAAKAEVSAALATFANDFFEPSVKRRRNLLEAVEQGQLSAEELPMDVLTVLLEDAQKLNMDADMLMREVAFYFLASAHTSVHSLGHSVHHLLNWCSAHADARAQLIEQPALVQQFVQESFRLHPSSPIAKRVALSPVTFLDGQQAAPGDTVIINLRQANRDESVFGTAGDRFDPYRQVRAGVTHTGVTFGIGMHACLGKNLAAGSPPRPNQPMQMGTVAWLSHALLQMGIEADPADPAQLDQAIERETWLRYPVRFVS